MADQKLSIQLLNHASVIITIGEIKMLCDPWFSGTCFEGGWGLKYDNAACLELSKQCTHLWVSHFHTDHFHMPTLKEVAKVNPEIVVLGNHSFNFKIDEAIKRAGFKTVVPLYERKWMKLPGNIDIIRYPSTGIDNMLVIKTRDTVILNFNDCNLPFRAMKSLARKIGKVDIMLNNYNHAGKLLDYPLPEAAEIQKQFKQNFIKQVDVFDPAFVIPFASHHYYKAKESQEQNKSLLEFSEIVEADQRVVPLNIGETIEFDDHLKTSILPAPVQITENEMEVLERTKHISFEELSQEFDVYSKKLRSSFLHLTFWVPELLVKVEDLDTILSVSINKGLTKVEDQAVEYHIVTTSEALHVWFGKLYGTDGFWIGAHFDINSRKTFPLRWQLLIGLLTENKLDFMSMIRMIFSAEGLKFLFCRREEILAVILGFNFAASLN